MPNLKLMLMLLLKQNETIAQKAFMGSDVMPRDKFVYVAESRLAGFSHCLFLANVSTVCSCRVGFLRNIFEKEKNRYLLHL